MGLREWPMSASAGTVRFSLAMSSGGGAIARRFACDATGLRGSGSWFSLKSVPKASGHFCSHVRPRNAGGNARSCMGSARVAVG